jgi:hypothetical protein
MSLCGAGVCTLDGRRNLPTYPPILRGTACRKNWGWSIFAEERGEGAKRSAASGWNGVERMPTISARLSAVESRPYGRGWSADVTVSP